MTPGAQLLPLEERVQALRVRVHCRLATTAEEREAIFALRYRAYRREGAVPENPTHLLTDPYDALPNARLVGLHLDGRLVGSVRLHLVSDITRDQSPALAVFGSVLNAAMTSHTRLLDPNRLVLEPDVARHEPELHWALLRVPMIAAAHFNVRLVTATVRPEHIAFYRRVLRFAQRSEPMAYPTLLTPLSLLTADFLPTVTAAIFRRFPHMRPDPDEGAALFGPAI